MPKPFDFLKRLLARGTEGQVIQIFTPQAAGERGLGTRLLLAGGTAMGLMVAGVTAIGALALLFLAVGAIYFLLTQVLGIRLDVDPRAFVQRAQEYAARN